MKKILFMAIAAFSLIAFAASCKKKVSDEDATKAAQEALTKAGMTTMVNVKEGVATITGECKDAKCQEDCKAAVTGVAGVKSVDVKCTITPAPVPASTTVNVSLDTKVQQKITDGIKDIKGATVTFEGKKAIFAGTFTTAQSTTLKQICGSVGVGADMTKATIK